MNNRVFLFILCGTAMLIAVDRQNWWLTALFAFATVAGFISMVSPQTVAYRQRRDRT